MEDAPSTGTEVTTVVGAQTDDGTHPGAPTPAPGRRLGRYLLLERIGRGGMGEVHLAYDPQLDRRIAIKLLRRGGPLAVSAQRLLREARSLAKLNHPNVVAVHDAGTVDPETLERTDEGGVVFLAMEFVAGETLSQWLTTKPSTRDILSVMQAAGRGLAAAHAAGIVHRDFKPANVMIGEDGRVRVVDFGVARRLTGSLSDIVVAPSLEASGPDLSAPSEIDPTDAGIVIGTPRYMAPEQMSGSAIDERTDQFSFCVVLYKALYGKRPFEGSTLRELFDAVQTPPKMDGPDAPRLPRRVRDAIARGMSTQPDARYPSMDALLDILASATKRQRGTWMVAGAAGLVLGAAGLGSWLTSREEPCTSAATQFEEAWSDQQREELAAAFEATGLSYAEDAARGATAALDDYAQRWIAMHTDACLATRVRGDQSEALMDQRMTCLDRRRRNVKVVVEVLLGAEPSAVENAVKAAKGIPSLVECEDVELLGQSAPLPDDPELRAAVEEAFDALAGAHALQLTGDYEAAAETELAVLETARELGVSALRARAAIELAASRDQLNRDDVVEVLLEGVRHAAAANDRRHEAFALAGLVQHLGYKQGDMAGAERYAEHVRGMIARMPDPGPVIMRLAVAEGAAYLRAGRSDDAERALLAGLEVDSDAEVSSYLRLSLLTNLGAAYGMVGRHDKAEDMTLQSLEIAEAELGPHHPMVGLAYLNLGASALHQGRIEEVMPRYNRALEILEAAFPNGHPQIAMVLSNRAQVFKLQGDVEAARREYEKALAMKIEHYGEKHDSTAHTANNLGDLLLEQGDLVAARRYTMMAVETWEDFFGASHPNVALALVTLAEIESKEGNPDKALELLERSHKALVDAGRPERQQQIIRFHIAHTLWVHGRDRERALALAKESLATAREDPTVSRTVLAAMEAALEEAGSAPDPSPRE